MKEFESVNINNEKQRVPRRVIHFSDGIMEEYSTDEEDETDAVAKQPEIDPVSL